MKFYQEHLNAFMLAGLGLGGVFGYLTPSIASETTLVGELFIRLLTLMIIPVIVLSMLSGVLNLGKPENLARLGFKTVLYYAFTTGLAVLTGLILVNVVQPGVGESPGKEQALTELREAMDSSEVSSNSSLADVARNIIPTNIIEAAGGGNVLGVIFFSIFLGVALLKLEHRGVPVFRDTINALFEAVMWMIEIALLIAPIGFFSLIAGLVADFVLQGQLEQLGTEIIAYFFTVVGGLAFHALVSLPLIALAFGISPLRFFQAMFPALTSAFSTASSSATMPITLECLEDRAGVPNKVGSFVVPLGATVNMDGTAIYEAVAVLFIANMLGVELAFQQQVIVFLTATFSAIGAAGIPGAGLIMMVLVLNSVGLPGEAVTLVVVVDRVLDMMRTAINVWGDSIGAAVISSSEGSPPDFEGLS